MTKFNRRILSGSLWFGVVANLSTMLYTFTGYFWWVPAPHPTDRYYMVTGYHVWGHVVGFVAVLVLATQKDPSPPGPPPIPPEPWSGEIVNDHDAKLGAGWVIVRLATGELVKVRVAVGWSTCHRGDQVFGTVSNGLYELTGTLPKNTEGGR